MEEDVGLEAGVWKAKDSAPNEGEYLPASP